MKEKKHNGSFSLDTVVIHSIAVLLAFFFAKDVLQAPLLWLDKDPQSLEVFENIVSEEASDDTESEEQEKEKKEKEGAEEFILSDKTVFTAFIENDKFAYFTVYLIPQGRVSEMLTPPPQQVPC